MPRPPRRRRSRARSRVSRCVARPRCAAVPPPRRVPPPTGLTMNARVLLQGHARLGLVGGDRGPTSRTTARRSAASSGSTAARRATPASRSPVDLPARRDKTLRLHAQPPRSAAARGRPRRRRPGRRQRRRSRSPSTTPTSSSSASSPSNPAGIVGEIQPAGRPERRSRAVVVPLDVADLPDRVEAWSRARPPRLAGRRQQPLVDASSSTALRGWLALGGRLVIVGGTAGIGTPVGLPGRAPALPARRRRVDVAPASLRAARPAARRTRPTSRRWPASSPAAARSPRPATASSPPSAPTAAARVTILGFDPTVGWLAEAKAGRRRSGGACSRPRSSGRPVAGDDSQIVGGGLQTCRRSPCRRSAGCSLLLVRLHRAHRPDQLPRPAPARPARVGLGHDAGPDRGLRRRRVRLSASALRGSDVIVNEVAIVRGAPDATEGTAQVYLGRLLADPRHVPGRACPGGALLSAPITGDSFGGQATRPLDILQGDAGARVRDLAVGFGSLRTVRAEIAGRGAADRTPTSSSSTASLTGTIRNDSDEPRGRRRSSSAAASSSCGDIAPGAHRQGRPAGSRRPSSGTRSSDQIVGQRVLRRRRRRATRPAAQPDPPPDHRPADVRPDVRHHRPACRRTGRSSSPWAATPILDVEIEGQQPRRDGNVLYYVPVAMRRPGARRVPHATCSGARSSSATPAFFSKDPSR